MPIRSRIRRLEKASSPWQVQVGIRDQIAELRARDRWLHGYGPEPPDPPCPRWIEPAHHRHCIQFGKALSMYLAGWANETGRLPGNYNAHLPTARLMANSLAQCEHFRNPDHVRAVEEMLGRKLA